MAKFKDLSGKYKTCGEAIETCTMGGWCTSCMYAYPGNGIIEGKPESYVDVCTMSKKERNQRKGKMEWQEIHPNRYILCQQSIMFCLRVSESRYKRFVSEDMDMSGMRGRT